MTRLRPTLVLLACLLFLAAGCATTSGAGPKLAMDGQEPDLKPPPRPGAVEQVYKGLGMVAGAIVLVAAKIVFYVPTWLFLALQSAHPFRRA